MISFHHISLAHNVLAYVEHVNTNPEVPDKFRVTTPVSFEGTIKLHGSNCGVVWDLATRSLTAQSRETELTPTSDYAGFAKFVQANETRIRVIFGHLVDSLDLESLDKVTLYGEWVGPGCVKKHKGAAVATFQQRHWALFSASALPKGSSEPVDITDLLRQVPAPEGQIGCVLSAGSYKLVIDFNDPEQVKRALEWAQSITDAVAKACPYGALYGLQGAGEGIVWRPVGAHLNRTDLHWKCKSEAHSVTDVKMVRERPVVPEDVQANIDSFLAVAVTQNRLEQGLDVLAQKGLPSNKKSTGPFVQWVSADVERECVLELAHYGLVWAQVQPGVMQRARDFILGKV